MSVAWAAGALTTMTFCWRIDRCDGVTIGLTAHDRDLWIDGLRYRSAPGITPSAIVRDDTLDAAALEVAGPLSHAAIGEADLIAGRFDGARVRLFATDWTSADQTIVLAEGRIGPVEISEGRFVAELRGAEVLLERPVVEETSPGCRAALGDGRCRVAMAGRRRFARVTAADGATLTLDQPVGGDFAWGRLRWVTGKNSGTHEAILTAKDSVVTLARPPRMPGAGAMIEIEEGCDRSLATCAGRFGNAANFRGEPYLPGIDLLTRYPGA